jgi:hypothetical protein
MRGRREGMRTGVPLDVLLISYGYFIDTPTQSLLSTVPTPTQHRCRTVLTRTWCEADIRLVAVELCQNIRDPWLIFKAMANAAFFKIVRHPVKFRLFLLKKLPAAYFSGVRVKAISAEECKVTVPFKWFTQNPFRSTYFACLAMAAEMSTGILAMAALYKRKPAVSMLIVNMEAQYFKKATGLSSFICKDGQLIREAIQEAVDTGEGRSIVVRSDGYNDNGELIASFLFTWSFKARQRKD